MSSDMNKNAPILVFCKLLPSDFTIVSTAWCFLIHNLKLSVREEP